MPEAPLDPEAPQDGVLPPAARRRPRAAILLSFLAIFVLLLVTFRSVLFPFLMAIYIAYLVEPLVSRATRSRLLGIKWTRGPTLGLIYVVVVGGLAVLGWVGIAKLAKTIRTASSDISATLEQDGLRAEFELAPPPPVEPPAEAPARVLLVPQGTELLIAGRAFETLYDVHIDREEPRANVLLEAVGETRRTDTPPASGSTAEFRDDAAVRYSDGKPADPADSARLSARAGGAASGMEYWAERKLISPIVKNLRGAGYDVEPDLVRDFVRIKAETLKEDLPERIGKGAVSMAGKVVLSIYTFFLILMLTAFIVMDRKSIAKFFASLPPPKYQPAYGSLVRYVDDGLAGVIRGQLVICGVNGVLTYFGLLVLGVPYALLLSSIAAVLSLIPVFGTIVSSIPIVIIGTTKGLDTGVLSLLWILGIHMLEANVLNPVIMGSHARMHPVIIIFALLAGEHAFGIWGALLAVPTASIIQSCFRFYLHEIEGLPQEEEAPHGASLRKLWDWVRARLGRTPPAASGGKAP